MTPKMVRLLLILNIINSCLSLEDLDGNKYVVIRPKLQCIDFSCERTVLLFEAFDRTFQIPLLLNKYLVTDDFFEQTLGEVKSRKSFPAKDEINCYYLSDSEEFEASISTCDHKVKGFFKSSHEGFHIDFNEKRKEHLLYQSEDLHSSSRGRCGVRDNVHPNVEEVSKETYPRTAQPKERFIELLIVNDNMFYRTFSSEKEVREFNLHAASLVNSYYLKLYPNLHVAVKGIIYWKDKDEIKVTGDAYQLLPLFKEYAASNLYPMHGYDSVQLFTAIKATGDADGLAYGNSVCTETAVGVVYLKGKKEGVNFATLVAHEIGHNVYLNHDDSSCGCSSSLGCIMHPTTLVLNNEWSTCSKGTIATPYVQEELDRCLLNKPIGSFPVCGNGIIETGEICDCTDHDQDCKSCCDTKTCRFKASTNVCSSGPCCVKCQFLPKAAQKLCREKKTDEECDVPEQCDGKQSSCPADGGQPDGTICDKGWCLKGKCVTRDTQCRDLLGPSSGEGRSDCFETFNESGTRRGHCGHVYRPSPGSYKQCKKKDVFCGLIHCKKDPANDFSRLDKFVYRRQLFFHEVCVTIAMLNVPEKARDPTLVWDQAKCGDNKWCSQGECVVKPETQPTTATPSTTAETTATTISCPQNCNGNGKCIRGQCLCKAGFEPPYCAFKTGTIASKATDSPGGGHGKLKWLVIALVIVLCLGAIVACILFGYEVKIARDRTEAII